MEDGSIYMLGLLFTTFGSLWWGFELGRQTEERRQRDLSEASMRMTLFAYRYRLERDEASGIALTPEQEADILSLQRDFYELPLAAREQVESGIPRIARSAMDYFDIKREETPCHNQQTTVL